jgi:hypothetical protein
MSSVYYGAVDAEWEINFSRPGYDVIDIRQRSADMDKSIEIEVAALLAGFSTDRAASLTYPAARISC